MATGLNAVTAPNEHAAKAASAALAGLRPALKKSARAKVAKITLTADGEKVVIPREAFDLFVRILAEMANGNAITIVPIHAELTTQQAADLLNISRPFLIGLLQQGKMPFRTVGTRRRVLFADLLEYKQREELRARDVLDELAREAEKLNLD